MVKNECIIDIRDSDYYFERIEKTEEYIGRLKNIKGYIVIAQLIAILEKYQNVLDEKLTQCLAIRR